MGVFRDIWRLMKVGAEQTAKTDYAEALRQSADLAEAWADADPDRPFGTHGAAAANPFANLEFMQSAIPAAGTVVALEATDQRLGEATIYEVRLVVRIDGREPYPAVYRTVIAAGALPNWQPGRMLPFRVSPEDPHALMLG